MNKKVMRSPGTTFVDFSSPDFYELFKKISEDFQKKHLSTPQRARKMLVKEGILTERGDLTRNYSGT